ncbi:sugar transferase [Spirulina sp. CS-785/01]|uniref:sugar transferase n=1 Tax=Spirulina sp. CS-785/01 TaxID=3021716 RepID=UPI00232D5FAB|nr:sugar transferase [Spirulina sp. CS-785/01]MDB9315528.1 sugar transferase [Spirulina sp. CS-785/01]
MTLATSAPIALATKTNHKQHHPSTRSTFKRFLDILGSLVGLMIVALLFIPIALAIKLESPGPIFFRQKRYGLHGETFTLYKFRSMYVDAEERKKQVQNQVQGLLFKNENDPRITSPVKVGNEIWRFGVALTPQPPLPTLGEGEKMSLTSV